MHGQWKFVSLTSIVMFAGCARQPAKPVEELGGGRDVSQFELLSLQGSRDGDRLDVKAVYGDGSDRIVVGLHFRVTPPPRLESGTWNGFSSAGGVRDRASTFLGGQSGPPSIGGSFDLLAPDGRPLYRITIPLQPLNKRL
jgi:hypothetical protein